MATRINTKFVITLVSIIVLMVLGLVFAFMFLKKTAADHINLAEAAMIRADAAIQQGDTKEHNSERRRAAKHYGAAFDKEADNTESLYGYIDAYSKIICDNLTTAGNSLDSILAGAASLHDTPGASDEDRKVLYEMLHNNLRMSLVANGQHPIGATLGFTTKRLDVAPEDPVANLYQALALSHLAQTRAKEAEVVDDIQKITAAADENPNNPWLQTALARYHQGNARRMYSAKGNTFTNEVNASYALSLEHIREALVLAEEEAPAYLDAAIVLADARTGDEAVAKEVVALRRQVAVALDAMLAEKANRDTLFLEELSNAAIVLQQTRPSEDAETEKTFNGPDRAISLAEKVVKDRSEEPSAYRLLGSLQQQTNRLDESIDTINDGLAVERLVNAVDYIRDQKALLEMKAMLADFICTKAFQSGGEERKTLLTESTSILEELYDAETLGAEQAQMRDARVNLIRGRIAMAQNQPSLAISSLDMANQVYNNRDVTTLRLLAQAHTQLNNDAMATGHYEAILATGRTTILDLLNLVNLYLNPGKNQQLEKAEGLLVNFEKIYPDDIRGVRLRARLLQEQDKTDEAIAFLQENLEKHPEVINQIVVLQAAKGDTSGVKNILRERLANTPEGEKMNVQLVSQLLNLISEPDEKLAELKKLVEQGLDSEFAQVLERMLSSGETTLEDELRMVELLQDDPAQQALQKYLTYRKWGEEEKGRALFENASKLSPNLPEIIEWRFKLALDEKRWEDAQQAIRDMLGLPASERTPLAIADGRFMRAQLLAVQAGAMEAGEARNKRIREAIISYNSALDQYSHYIDGWVQLARLYLTQENYFAAQDSLQEALNRQSKNVEAIELLGMSQQASGDQINALENYQQALALKPNNPNVLNRFTALAQQMGLNSRAIQQRELISQRLPGNYDNRRSLALLYSQTNAHAEAMKTIGDVIDKQGMTLQNIAVLAEVLASNDQLDQAIKAVNNYLAAQGDKAIWRDYLLQAQIYERAEDARSADTAFAKAIELEKAEGTLLSAAALGQTLINRGQVKDAAELFEGMIDQYPENEQLKLRTAEIYLGLQDFEKAESIVNAMAASAQRDRILVRSASAQQGKLGIAIERAKTAVKAYPSDFTLRLNLVELLRVQQDQQPADKRDYSKVLPQAKALVKANPDRVEAMVALADVLLRVDMREQAAAELEKALTFAPRHFGANERLARVKIAMAGQSAQTDPDLSNEMARESMAILSMLIEAQPQNTALLRLAGQAAESAGLPAQALDYYRRAYEAGQNAENLATYATALLASNQGENARIVLDSTDNASLVSNSLYLRALLGRAFTASGQAVQGANIFRNLLKESKEPGEQMLVARQVLMAFSAQPTKAIELFESTYGKNLPVAVDGMLTDVLLARREYELATKRLIKYWAEPAEDVRVQVSLLTQLALAQQESGQLTQAKATYDKVYGMWKENEELITRGQLVQLLNNMAYLLADQLTGYTNEAVAYAKQAVGLMSDDDGARQRALIEDTLGWALHKAGQNDEAIRVLKQSIARVPLAANQLHLGKVYLSMGDKDKALLVLKEARDLARAEGDQKLFDEAQTLYNQAL